MAEEEKTLGQIAYEARHERSKKIKGHAGMPWDRLSKFGVETNEAAAKAVAERCAQVAIAFADECSSRLLRSPPDISEDNARKAGIAARAIAADIRALANGGGNG